ncbi:MAG: hypothetical protein B7Z38_05850 [Rhodobacterales bacterium 12-64-8]|nr:MAG: hypothetical protein B7Z38_05850 [Rhodobacterales bacterium 12-64-8]
MSIAAEVQRIRDVFSPGADIRVPPFQRAYAWEDEETEVMIRDLLEAFRAGTVYFLGAIVVIRPKNKGPSDVVDGQQRLTTLTIMLAVLRDLAAAREQEGLHNMIGHETMGMVFGGGHHWRMTLNRSDTPFFRRFVQERGGTKSQDAMMEAVRVDHSPSQARIAAAVAQVYDFMTDMTDEERARFATWLLDEVSIVRVRVSEYAVAYKVFQSLNHRGKPLSDHDILKSALFERAGFTTQEAAQQSERWNGYTTQLGDRGFADMWKQIRSLYDRLQCRGQRLRGADQAQRGGPAADLLPALDPSRKLARARDHVPGRVSLRPGQCRPLLLGAGAPCLHAAVLGEGPRVSP